MFSISAYLKWISYSGPAYNSKYDETVAHLVLVGYLVGRNVY